MVFVLSSPEPVLEEADHINRLFDAGLSVFHLRKPESSEGDVAHLLEEIKAEHHSKIALHQHHGLAKRFEIVRLHYNESTRNQVKEESLNVLKLENKILSTSIHTIEDYEHLSSCFDYTFLGPLFDSVSKANYKALTAEKRILPSHKKQTKLIALGGIHAANCTLPYEWGFDGIALLGALWNDPRFSINQFKLIHAACATIVQ